MLCQVWNTILVFTRFGSQFLTSNELLDSSAVSSYQVNLNLAVTKMIAFHFQRTSAIYRPQLVVIANREECATIYPLMNICVSGHFV
jgi:hypothetical protein